MSEFVGDDEPEPGPIRGEGEDEAHNFEQDVDAVTRLCSLADDILVGCDEPKIGKSLYLKAGCAELTYWELDDGTHEYGFYERAHRRASVWCTWRRGDEAVNWGHSRVVYESVEMVIERIEQLFLSEKTCSEDVRRGFGAMVLGKLRRI